MNAHIGNAQRAWRYALVCVITLISGLLVVPISTEAQQRGDIRKVVVLQPELPANATKSVCTDGFRQKLRDLGYVEGHNIVLTTYYAAATPERFSTLATELVRLAPDAIWTHSGRMASLARQGITTLPVVIGVASDLVEEGIVASLAQPGGNITGMELRDLDVVGRRLELFKEAVPKISRVAVLVDPTMRYHANIPGNIEAEARSLGVQLHRVEAGSPEDFEAAFAAMVLSGAEGLLIMDGVLFAKNRHKLLELARQHRLPTMAGGPHFAEAGSLLSYGAFARDLCERSAVYVDKILKGARPAELPVGRPTKFYLVVNLKTAAALGLTLPSSVLYRADKIIR